MCTKSTSHDQDISNWQAIEHYIHIMHLLFQAGKIEANCQIPMLQVVKQHGALQDLPACIPDLSPTENVHSVMMLLRLNIKTDWDR